MQPGRNLNLYLVFGGRSQLQDLFLTGALPAVTVVEVRPALTLFLGCALLLCGLGMSVLHQSCTQTRPNRPWVSL